MASLQVKLKTSEGVPYPEVRGCSVSGSPRIIRIRNIRVTRFFEPARNISGVPFTQDPRMFRVRKSTDFPYPEVRGFSGYGTSGSHAFLNRPGTSAEFRAWKIRGCSVHVTTAEHPCTEHPRMFRVGSKRRVTRKSVKSSVADKDVPRRKSFGVPTDHPLFGGMAVNQTLL